MKKIALTLLFLLSFLLIGCSGSNVDIDELTLFNSNLLAVEENGRYGYINKKGEVEIPFLFDDASAFYDGLAIVEVNNEMFIIDTNGNYLIGDGKDSIYHDLNTGNFIFQNNGKWGVMNKSGKIIVEALYDTIKAYNDGLARVQSGSKFGFIDKDGKVVIDLDYYGARDFVNGYAGVMNQNDKWGFIDKNGEVKISHSYDWVGDFDKLGNVIVNKEIVTREEYSLIDAEGTIILEDADSISFSGVFYALEEDGEVELYNADGTRFNDNVYDDLWYMTGYAANLEFEGDDLNILFNEDGEVIAEADYSDSDIYSMPIDGKRETVLIVEDGDKIEIYYRDKYFRLTADDLTQIISENEFILERDNRMGIVDQDGKTKVQFLYDRIGYSNDGYYVFEVNSKIGVMNNKYETIISAKYDDIVISPNIVWL